MAFRKLSDKIGTVWKKGIPVEVIPISYRNVKSKLESILGGEANLRMAVAKAVSNVYETKASKVS